MIVGIVEMEIYIYEVNSLKEKRQVVKSLIERLKNKHNISIAEIGDLELWNKLVLGISVVSNSKLIVEKSIESIRSFVENDHRVEIVNTIVDIA